MPRARAFANPELSVQHIAELLGCSADYLSHLFHVETKERLTHYIQRIRIEGAVLALETTSLNISEIAYAGRLCRPDLLHPGLQAAQGRDTPRVPGAARRPARKRVESQPKTVYYDQDRLHPRPAQEGHGRRDIPGASRRGRSHPLTGSRRGCGAPRTGRPQRQEATRRRPRPQEGRARRKGASPQVRARWPPGSAAGR
jgi:AraC-like DNA-binding protein